MIKMLVGISWLLFTPILLMGTITGAYLFKYRLKPITLEPVTTYANSQTLQASGTAGAQVRGISTDVQTADARPVIIAEFLKKHQSPLQPYDYWGEFLTELADKYELDFRLLPAISMQESNLCKKIPEGTFNCLGLGIHSRGTWHFEKFEDNFEAAARILRKNYIDQGLITPDEIQTKYTPGSNGSWEFAVNHFMDILEKADF